MNIKPMHILILAAICLSIYVYTFTIPIPVFDPWEMVSLLKHPTINALWQQHGEHRMFFPKLVYVGLAHISHWDLRYETGFHLLTFAAMIFLIYFSFKERVSNGSARWIFCLALLTEFSPIDHGNLLFGFQLQLGLCFLMVYLTFMLIPRAEQDVRSLIGAIIASIIASFSYFSGLLAWFIAVFAYIRLNGFRHSRLLTYCFFCLVTIGAFFSLGYRFHVAHVTANAQISLLDKMLQIPAAFFIFTGANFILTASDKILSIPLLLLIAGLLGFLLSLAGLFLVVKTWGYDRSKTVIPYCMMLFEIFSAALISFGRTDIEFKAVLYIRYHSIQMFYFIGLIWLMVLYFEKINILKSCSKWLISIFILITAFNWIGGIGLGVYKLKYFKPAAIELHDKGGKISRENALKIYENADTLPEKIMTLKKLRYNIFYDK